MQVKHAIRLLAKVLAAHVGQVPSSAVWSRKESNVPTTMTSRRATSGSVCASMLCKLVARESVYSVRLLIKKHEGKRPTKKNDY